METYFRMDHDPNVKMNVIEFGAGTAVGAIVCNRLVIIRAEQHNDSCDVHSTVPSDMEQKCGHKKWSMWCLT